MARNACLAIGISDAPPLDYLPGAVNGARAIAEWAKRSGYVTEMLTDEEDPVGTAEVDAALRKLLPKNEKTDRLIVYFAGHGLTRGAFEDLWLLSQWFEMQRAVSIEGLRARLARFGVGQVAIISDACRSLPVDADTAELVADSVLGRGPFDLSKPSVDTLKASTKYRAAYMIPGEREEDDRCLFTGVLEEALWGLHQEAEDGLRPGPPKCITSGSLARFLRMEVPRKAKAYKIELDPDIQPGFEQPDDVYVSLPVADPPAVRPWPAAVATAAMGVGDATGAGGKRGWSTKGAAAEKEAEIDWSKGLDSLDPSDFIAGFGERDGASGGMQHGSGGGYAGIGDPDGGGGGWRPRVSRDRGEPGSASGWEPPAPIAPRPTIRALAAEERKRFAKERRRKKARADTILGDYRRERPPRHYETGAGLSVVGADVRRVCVGSRAKVEFDPGQQQNGDAPRPGWRIWNTPQHELKEAVSLLVELKSGIWAGAAAMPTFITRLGFEAPASGSGKQRTESLIYSPSWQPQKSQDAEHALAQLRAGISDRSAAVDFAVNLRTRKHQDPVLGVIAAYMYYAIGDVASIRQIAYYFARAGQPIPYDIVLLADVDVNERDGQLMADIPAVASHKPETDREAQFPWAYEETYEASAPVAGAFPWLRQGWSLIEAAEAPLVPRGLTAIGEGLLPGTFTTLDARSGKRLLKLIGGAPK